ncbi:hypothetical protein [Candidatus Magnetobacterium casense]|nr:hypothetical protein [Candidatus Magnetobacterium casensis]
MDLKMIVDVTLLITFIVVALLTEKKINKTDRLIDKLSKAGRG